MYIQINPSHSTGKYTLYPTACQGLHHRHHQCFVFLAPLCGVTNGFPLQSTEYGERPMSWCHNGTCGHVEWYGKRLVSANHNKIENIYMYINIGVYCTKHPPYREKSAFSKMPTFWIYPCDFNEIHQPLFLYSTFDEFDSDTAYLVCISVSLSFPYMVSISLGFPYMVMLHAFERKHHCSECCVAMGCYRRSTFPGAALWRQNVMAIIVPRNTRGPGRDANQTPWQRDFTAIMGCQSIDNLFDFYAMCCILLLNNSIYISWDATVGWGQSMFCSINALAVGLRSPYWACGTADAPCSQG